MTDLFVLLCKLIQDAMLDQSMLISDEKLKKECKKPGKLSLQVLSNLAQRINNDMNICFTSKESAIKLINIKCKNHIKDMQKLVNEIIIEQPNTKVMMQKHLKTFTAEYIAQQGNYNIAQHLCGSLFEKFNISSTNYVKYSNQICLAVIYQF